MVRNVLNKTEVTDISTFSLSLSVVDLSRARHVKKGVSLFTLICLKKKKKILG